MTETQTPNPDCPQCAGTGFIPPFMDQCECPAGFVAAVDAADRDAATKTWGGGPDAEVTHATARIGEMTSHSLTGETAVWTGTEWKPVKTEALTPAEYAAKYGPPAPDWLPPLTSAPMAIDPAVQAASAPVLADSDDMPFFNRVPEPGWDGMHRSSPSGWAEFDQDDTAEAEVAAAAAMVDEVDAEFEAKADVDLTGDEARAIDATLLCPDCKGEGFPTPDFAECPTCRGTGLHPERLAPDPKPDYASGYGEAGIYSDPSISYGSSKPKPKVLPRPMTASQNSLLTRLIAERDATNPVVAHAATRLAEPLSAGEASKLIDVVMVIPADPALKPARSNSYDGTCRHCGGTVAANTGVIDKIDGRWKTAHKPGECLTAEAKLAHEADKVTEPGLYKHEVEGVPAIFRVRKSRSSSRLYAEKVCIHEHDGDKTVAFAYNAKAMGFLRASSKLTWLEARDFGAAYGACIACGRTLSDPRSLVQQYGSTCAGHYGWPTVTKKQAEAIIEGVLTWDDVIAGLGVLTS